MEEGTWPDLTPWFHEAHWICEEYPSAEKFFNLKSSVNTSEDKDDDKLGGLFVQLKLMSEDRRCWYVYAVKEWNVKGCWGVL